MSLGWDDPNSDPLQDLRDFKARWYAEPWKPTFVIFNGALLEGHDIMSDDYVAIYPYSNTNPTAKFRVARASDWQLFIDGEKTTYPFDAYDKFDQAIAARDRKNGVVKPENTDTIDIVEEIDPS